MDLMVTHPKVAAHWAPSQIGRPGGRGAFSRNHRRNGNYPGESWYLMGFEPKNCDLWWVNGFVTTYSLAIEEFAIWKPWPCRCFIVLTCFDIYGDLPVWNYRRVNWRLNQNNSGCDKQQMSLVSDDFWAQSSITAEVRLSISSLLMVICNPQDPQGLSNRKKQTEDVQKDYYWINIIKSNI